jgi:predicted AlkP superfamily pyrophosphatase or phosphodiesterase
MIRQLALLFIASLGIAFSRAASVPRPIVVLVSFDGWRWDYLARSNAPNLRSLAAQGVEANGLIPSFPSVTFPNHYTIVTGLYPEHHGIVANAMTDPALPGRFTMSSEASRDPAWWGGEPIWITAARQGLRSASMFWPGSEVRGRQPTYWRPFDESVPNHERVRQVLEWLALPDDRQPSFVTLYFDELDHAGHDHGPQSKETLDAAGHLDAALGELVAGVKRLNLSDRTNFVVVSDHGMSELSQERVIFLDDYLDLSTVDVVDWSPTLTLVPRSTSPEHVVQELRGRSIPAFTVYTREQLPAGFHHRDDRRVPPVVGLADEGWTITTHQRLETALAAGRWQWGEHGYDPKYRSMQGLFVAAGPLVARGVVAPSFENVHVYDFLCELLGLTPAPNDGDPTITRGFLAH